VQKPTGKFLVSIFWDQDCIHLKYFLRKVQTKNADHYSPLLVQLKDILKEKRRGNFTEGSSSLHNNALAHRVLATQKKLDCLGFQYLDNPFYSRDLALSEYNLFLRLKKQLKCRLFPSDAEVIFVADTWLDGQTYYFLFSGLQKSQPRAKMCIDFV
jgi:hypothetical protein